MEAKLEEEKNKRKKHEFVSFVQRTKQNSIWKQN